MLLGKYINKYYLKYGIFFLIGIIALILVDYYQTLVPEYLGDIVGMLKNGYVDKSLMMDILFGVIIVALVLFLGRVSWRLTIFYASSKIEANLRHEMFLKAERLSSSYYHENKVGNIMSWFTTDLETIEEYFGWGTIMIIDAIFLSLIVLIKMFKLDWVLSIVALVPIILIVIWGALAEKKMSKLWEYRQKAYDELYDFTQENFTGIRVIKAFVKELQEINAFKKVARRNQKVNNNFVKISVLFDSTINLITYTTTALIIGFGGYFVFMAITGTPVILFGHEVILGAEHLITFVGYFDTLIWPMIALGQIVSMRSRAKTSLNRVTNFLDQEEDIKNVDNPVILENALGKITYKNFNFKYPNSDLDSLNDISLEIKAGETIGVVGKIGCGKTTLINSLLRLYNVDRGTIFIDDVDIMDIDINNLRDIIAYVPQDNFLFSDKVRNNIAFSNTEIDFENIKKAAEFADVHQNIEEFSDGYDTISGERGVTLSGGQKQRISIARAYLKDSPIMILDDSVSAVDIKTEETILQNIKKYREGKTTILVASRVSTVMHLDKIIVLKDGKVEAFDNHKNLLNTSKTYARMVYLQELEKEVEGGK